MDTLISSHTIKTIREVWWDIRPHPSFGTVEIRVCDGIPTLREVGVDGGAEPVPGAPVRHA